VGKEKQAGPVLLVFIIKCLIAVTDAMDEAITRHFMKLKSNAALIVEGQEEVSGKKFFGIVRVATSMLRLQVVLLKIMTVNCIVEAVM